MKAAVNPFKEPQIFCQKINCKNQLYQFNKFQTPIKPLVMKKKKSKGGSAYNVNTSERILPEEGMHNARVVRFLELGTQDGGEFGDKFKVQLSFELVDASAVFNEENGEQNFMVHRKYNRSLHKRSDLGKAVRAILGKDFPEEGEIEMDTLADMPCQVEVTHSEDGQYANVTNVVAAPKTGKVAKSENEFISLYLDDNFDEDVFDSLHDGLREKIEASPEYQELFPDAKPKRKGKAKDEDEDEDEDEKPARKKTASRKNDDDDEDEEEEKPRRKTAAKKTAKKAAKKSRR